MDKQKHWGTLKNSDTDKIMEFWRNTQKLNDTERIQEMKRFCEFKKYNKSDAFNLIYSIEEVVNGLHNERLDDVYKLVKNEALFKEEPEPSIKQVHFNLPKEKAELLYSKLMESAYINTETSKEHLVYWFSGGSQPADLRPIEWVHYQNRLARLVNMLFSDMGLPHWKYTEQAFRVKGKKPNTGTMIPETSALKNDYKTKEKFKEIDAILKD